MVNSLNSIGANYGSGSSQQVVTSINEKKSEDSLWIIKDAQRASKRCRAGDAIKCGDKIRLEHNETGKNLHSHRQFKAPISGRQEVSGFGNDGRGDAGDDWQIVCNENRNYGQPRGEGDQVHGSDFFHLKHVDTGCMLVTDSNSRFNNSNCPRCPILGQLEVACEQNKLQKSTLWRMDSGFFFPLREEEEEDATKNGDSWGTDEL